MDKYSSGLKDRVKALLKYYVDSSDKGLEEFKRNDNIEIYKTFIDVFSPIQGCTQSDFRMSLQEHHKHKSNSRFSNSSENEQMCQGWHVDGIKRNHNLR